MKILLRTQGFAVVFVISLFLADTTLAALPKFKYLGGHANGDASGTLLQHPAVGGLQNFLIKRQSRPGNTARDIHFALVTTATYRVKNSCWGDSVAICNTFTEATCTGANKCSVEDVWETDITSANNVPTFYRPNGNNPIRVELPGSTTAGCKVNYVTIDDFPDGRVDGFYVSTNSLPANISLCANSNGPQSNAAATCATGADNAQTAPVYCSPEGMVVEGCFISPRSGKLTIVSEDSLGLAAVTTCEPDPPVETDFNGFLWKIGPTCDENASQAERTACKLNSSEFSNTVELTLRYADDNSQIGAKKNYSGDSFSFNDVILIDNRNVKICTTDPQDPAGGDYTMAVAYVGGNKVSTTATCTAAFNPNNGGSNTVQIGYNYIPPTFDPPWFTTLNGDVFAGNNRSIINDKIPTSGTANGFTTNLVQGIGSTLGDNAVTLANPNQYAQNGSKITNFTSANEWPINFPPTLSGIGTLPASYALNSAIYSVNVGALNTWLGLAPKTYTVGGTTNLAIIYVTGSGVIEFKEDFVNASSDPDARVIIIAPNAQVSFVANTGFGTSNVARTSSPNIRAGLIVGNSITATGVIPAVSNSLVYQGFMANYKSGAEIRFTWDMAAANTTLPSTYVQYDPLFLFAIQELELSGVNTGLTKFDLTWEVLD